MAPSDDFPPIPIPSIVTTPKCRARIPSSDATTVRGPTGVLGSTRELRLESDMETVGG